MILEICDTGFIQCNEIVFHFPKIYENILTITKKYNIIYFFKNYIHIGITEFLLALTKNKLGKLIKAVRSYNAKEYLRKLFNRKRVRTSIKRPVLQPTERRLGTLKPRHS